MDDVGPRSLRNRIEGINNVPEIGEILRNIAAQTGRLTQHFGAEFAAIEAQSILIGIGASALQGPFQDHANFGHSAGHAVGGQRGRAPPFGRNRSCRGLSIRGHGRERDR